MARAEVCSYYLPLGGVTDQWHEWWDHLEKGVPRERLTAPPAEKREETMLEREAKCFFLLNVASFVIPGFRVI